MSETVETVKAPEPTKILLSEPETTAILGIEKQRERWLMSVLKSRGMTVGVYRIVREGDEMFLVGDGTKAQ